MGIRIRRRGMRRRRLGEGVIVGWAGPHSSRKEGMIDLMLRILGLDSQARKWVDGCVREGD